MPSLELLERLVVALENAHRDAELIYDGWSRQYVSQGVDIEDGEVAELLCEAKSVIAQSKEEK